MFNKKIKSELLDLRNEMTSKINEVQKELFNLQYPYGCVTVQGNVFNQSICYEYKHGHYAEYYIGLPVGIESYKIKRIDYQIYLYIEYICSFNNATQYSKIFMLVDDKLIEINADIDFSTYNYDSKNNRL